MGVFLAPRGTSFVHKSKVAKDLQEVGHDRFAPKADGQEPLKACSLKLAICNLPL